MKFLGAKKNAYFASGRLSELAGGDKFVANGGVSPFWVPNFKARQVADESPRSDSFLETYESLFKCGNPSSIC